MTRIAVLGGTGYTGANIVSEAASRGHEVVSYSRTAPDSVPDGVSHVAVDVTEAGLAERVVADVDVVVSALSPRGALEGNLEGVDLALAAAATAAGVRVIVVGGFGSLRPVEGAPRIAEGADFPEAYRPESLEMARVLSRFEAGEASDWLYVSPSAGYGAFAPGEATGTYRVGGAVVTPDAGDISGADFATAVVDEVERKELSGHVSVFA